VISRGVRAAGIIAREMRKALLAGRLLFVDAQQDG